MVPTHLRYSPVNFLIVNWGTDGRAFDMCGMPTPRCDEPVDEHHPAPCRPLPIAEAIDTYDWLRWLPEVLIGIEDPDEEIAANYVRQAAIEFCKGARVLQRQVVIELQCGVSTYPVFPYEGENIIGVIAAKLNNDGPCGCSGDGRFGMANEIRWVFDRARNQISIPDGCHRDGLLQLLVWAAPTENACAHDVFLYDDFRYDITQAARMMYANAVHFRDRPLMASLSTGESISRSIVLAKRRAMQTPSSWKTRSGSGMWDSNCCRRTR